jgi:alpha-amylase
LPGCERFNDESCQGGQQFHANEGLNKRRWQTPKPGTPGYQPSYQDNYALVGYADIRYTSAARTSADVCIVALHKTKGAQLTYYFEGQAQTSECKRFDSSHKGKVALKVTCQSDSTQLEIAAVSLIWNLQKLADRPGDFRSGQKGAIAELFGWPHKDVQKECELIAKAGYLGAKLFPIHEQLMSHQPFNDVINPWYFMYQPVSYKLDGRAGTREDLISLINTCRSFGARVYADVIFNHFTGAGNDMLNHRNPSAGCAKWGNKTTSAPLERQSPFFSHAFTYEYNQNTGEAPSNEFPGAGLEKCPKHNKTKQN